MTYTNKTGWHLRHFVKKPSNLEGVNLEGGQVREYRFRGPTNRCREWWFREPTKEAEQIAQLLSNLERGKLESVDLEGLLIVVESGGLVSQLKKQSKLLSF